MEEWDGIGFEKAVWTETTYLPEDDILLPFAEDEILMRRLKAEDGAVVRVWRHPRAFVLGLRDSRLPFAASAVRRLHEDGYATAVRNSGGAAVPLDLGVVNVSLLLPMPERSLAFRDDFVRMLRWFRLALAEWRPREEIESGEVEGAYCPGEFDLAIQGKKFCGMAQRRQAAAIAVQAFVVADGSGVEQAKLVERFYRDAAGNPPQTEHPRIEPERTASLQESAGVPSAEAFIAALKRSLSANCRLREADDSDRLSDERGKVMDMVAELRRRYGLPVPR